MMDFMEKHTLLTLINTFATETAKNTLYAEVSATKDVAGDRDEAHRYYQLARKAQDQAHATYANIRRMLDNA